LKGRRAFSFRATAVKRHLFLPIPSAELDGLFGGTTFAECVRQEIIRAFVVHKPELF
jgi:hypothetical protein